MMKEQKDKIQTVNVRNQYLAAIVVDILAVFHGVSIGWTSPSVFLLTSEETPLASGVISMEEASYVASLPCFGAMFGNILFGFITRRFGRKTPLILLAIPILISWLLILFAQNVCYLFVARVLYGICGGSIIVAMPLYLTEISHDSIRGVLGSTIVLSANGGVLLAYTLGNYFDYFLTPKCVIVLVVIFIVLFSFFPETPAFFVKQNKLEEAKKSIAFYQCLDQRICEKERDCIIQLEINKLRSALSKTGNDDGKSFNWSDLFTNPARKSILIGIGLVALNQISGCVTIMYYLANIFASTRSPFDPNTSAMIVGVVQFFGNILATNLVDRAGRKFLYAVSSIGSGVGLAILGVYMMLIHQGYNVDAFNWIPIVSVSFVVMSAACAILTLPFVMIAEVMPANMKEFGSSFCLSMLWFLAFLVLKCLPLLIVTFSYHGMMFSFAGVCFIGAVLVILFLPETKGKSYEQIMEMLQ